MGKLGLNLLLIVSVFVIASTSCSNKESEKRIAELENRLKELESTPGASSPVTAAAPTTTPQPEVKPDGPLPSFKFEEMEHDFGAIKEGDIVEHTFEFTNTGDAPLIIQSARGSCGCTVPEWPKEPIPVGGTSQVKASYNSKGKSGMENKSITLTANTWPKQTVLRIKAQVQKASTADGPVK
ncbi:MAG: DUF1573 domain-containing protein [Cyclobacteriaceae bacterium]|nr:DUF1573 domain-containing protein [Cyclobacteriaceae bacterium]